MNSNLKNLIYAVSSIVIILPAILFTSDYINYSLPMEKMILWEDPFFNDPEKFVEVSNKKGSTCFTTPSMNYFCYSKPIIYEDGIPRTSYVVGENGISGELHFDSINEGEFYFTMKNMSVIKGDTVIITFADNDYRVGNMDRTIYDIIDEFEFSTVIEKFDTFIVKCDNYEGTSVTIVQYLGIDTIDDVEYFITWHTRADSESGITCDYPQIIQHSFGHDFGI